MDRKDERTPAETPTTDPQDAPYAQGQDRGTTPIDAPLQMPLSIHPRQPLARRVRAMRAANPTATPGGIAASLQEDAEDVRAAWGETPRPIDAYDDMTADEARDVIVDDRFDATDVARIVILDASGDIRPEDSRRAKYTPAMRAHWDELQQWYRDHPGAILEVSNELEVDTEDDPGIIKAALGARGEHLCTDCWAAVNRDYPDYPDEEALRLVQAQHLIHRP